MIVKRCFTLEETPSMPGKYIIRVVHDKFYCKGTTGSYGVLPARLLGISYVDYLRLCRDEGGALVIGKNNKYPIAYFDNNETTKKFLHLINAYATMVVWNKEHPDYPEHEQELNELEQKMIENFKDEVNGELQFN